LGCGGSLWESEEIFFVKPSEVAQPSDGTIRISPRDSLLLLG
jgi:hypothetical protein